MSEQVIYKAENRIGFITLNRPEKRNALSFDLVQQLKDTLRKAELDEQCKVIVLKAHGDAFCAGADLAYLQQLQQNTFEENLADSRHLMELFQLIYTNKKIVIAQVEGAALAGGSGLATVCDFCFATPAATFGYTEVKIGFVPAIVMVYLVRKVTEHVAKNLLLTGQVFNAEKALGYGLINEVVEHSQIAEHVIQFAQPLIKQTSAQSTAMVKAMLGKVQELSLEDGLEYAANMNAKARSTDDCKKGINAFLNKEKLSW